VLQINGGGEADSQHPLYDCDACVAALRVEIVESRRNERRVCESFAR
jgi:hypothetical protein